MQGSGLSESRSRISMIADMLGWGVRQHIPLPEVLKSIPSYRKLNTPLLNIRIVLGWFLAPFLLLVPLSSLTDIQWSYLVRRLIRGLEKGERLSFALRRTFPGQFPEFYLLGVERAEQNNRLETALPLLANQINYLGTVTRERKAGLFFAVQKLLITVYFLLFILFFVAPKFIELGEDISPDSSGIPWIFKHRTHLELLIPAPLILFLFVVLMPGMGRLGEFISLHIPFVGREYKRFALGDLAVSMATFLRQGDDILSATQWSLKATRSRWLRRRLSACIQKLQQGVRWDVAWGSMRLGRPMDQWVLTNAARREDPASGFELLAEWLQQEIDHSTRRLLNWVDPVCTLITAGLVGTLAYYLFSVLLNYLYALM